VKDAKFPVASAALLQLTRSTSSDPRQSDTDLYPLFVKQRHDGAVVVADHEYHGE
jgi:hypothetical protein